MEMSGACIRVLLVSQASGGDIRTGRRRHSLQAGRPEPPAWLPPVSSSVKWGRGGDRKEGQLFLVTDWRGVRGREV